jgi:alpha-tubulin suppressor-like RCC1 family protein
LAAGGRSTCALFANGGVKCWGFNGLGTLGYGDTTNRGTSAAHMGTNLPYVDLGTDRTAVAIAAKGWHVCVILDNGSVKCWGNSDGGQLGYGDTVQRGDGPGEMGDNLPTVNLGTGRTAKKIAVSFNTTCAILDNNSLKCWGFNTVGQLGLGDSTARGNTSGTMGDALPAVNLGAGRYATDIAMGADTTCVLLDDATVKCWGSPIYGHGVTQTQIGREPSHMGDALLPFDLGSDVLVQKISVGLHSVCAIYRTTQSATPAAKCWGSNDQGELGYGLTYGESDIRGDEANEMGNALPTIAFGGANPVLLASHGTSDTTTFRCALLSDGSATCWGGANTNGELGAGSMAAITDAPSTVNPVDVGSGRTVQQIVVGESHACVLLDNSDVKCWGRNSAGQLGLGHVDNRGETQGQMGDALLAVNLGTGQSATATPSPATTATATANATATPSRTATTLSTSTLTATPTRSLTASPTRAANETLTPVAAISAGDNHTCLLSSTGNLRCYGYNYFGQLGYGNTNNYGMFDTGPAPTLPLVDVSSSHAVVDIQISGTHSCALLSNGTVKCWGNADRGVLGYENETNIGDSSGEMGTALPTVNLGTGRTARAIAVGERNSCALLDDNRLVCWGNGIGSSDGIRHGSIPDSMGDNLPVISLSSTQSIESISVGETVVCAVLSDATLKCFGMNSNGVLGVPYPTYMLGFFDDMGDALPTVNLGSSSAVRAVAVGKWHACAIVNAGRVKCWGYNEEGQLGNGATASIGDDVGEMGDNLPFVDLGNGRSARAISAGSRHTCAVLDNNALKCWGANMTGELGQGNADNIGDNPGEMGDALAPIDLGTTVTIQSVAVGDEHTCVLFVDRSVRCFGRGREGQLGYGNFFDIGTSPSHMGSALPWYAVEPLYAATATPTPLATATAVPSATFTASTTRTASKTATPTKTLTPSKTLTRSLTATQTRSLTPTKIATLTASVTRTKPTTLRPSSTRTRTKLLSPTKSPTRTKTLTRTRTPARRP